MHTGEWKNTLLAESMTLRIARLFLFIILLVAPRQAETNKNCPLFKRTGSWYHVTQKNYDMDGLHQKLKILLYFPTAKGIWIQAIAASLCQTALAIELEALSIQRGTSYNTISNTLSFLSKLPNSRRMNKHKSSWKPPCRESTSLY
jgi:hypothetical protein